MARWYVIQQRSGLALHAGAEPHPAIRLDGPFDDAEVASRVLMQRINERERAFAAWSTVIAVLMVVLIGVMAAQLMEDARPCRQQHPIREYRAAVEPHYSPNPGAEVIAHGFRPCTGACID